MTRPTLLFPDAVVVTLAVLRGRFAADPSVTADPPTITHKTPSRDTWTAQPAVVVSDDGDAGSERLLERATVRVTVYGTDPYRVEELARLARAYLLAHRGDADSAGFRNGTRPFTAPDPVDGDLSLASFTAEAALKPRII